MVGASLELILSRPLPDGGRTGRMMRIRFIANEFHGLSVRPFGGLSIAAGAFAAVVGSGLLGVAVQLCHCQYRTGGFLVRPPWADGVVVWFWFGGTASNDSCSFFATLHKVLFAIITKH